MSWRNTTTILRWTARIWGIASLASMSAFIIGELQRPGNWPTLLEWTGLAFFPSGVVIGLLLAWWREAIGGSIAILSLVGFYAWHATVAGDLPNGAYFALVAAPGQ